MKKNNEVLKQTQAQFVVQEMEYAPTLNEIKTDMLMFSERLVKAGFTTTANKLITIAKLLEVTVSHVSGLATKENWELD